VSWPVFDLERHAAFAETVQSAVKEWDQLNIKMKELREPLHEGSWWGRWVET
jgi:hypothetical protein